MGSVVAVSCRRKRADEYVSGWCETCKNCGFCSSAVNLLRGPRRTAWAPQARECLARARLWEQGRTIILKGVDPSGRDLRPQGGDLPLSIIMPKSPEPQMLKKSLFSHCFYHAKVFEAQFRPDPKVLDAASTRPRTSGFAVRMGHAPR